MIESVSLQKMAAASLREREREKEIERKKERERERERRRQAKRKREEIKKAMSRWRNVHTCTYTYIHHTAILHNH